MAEGPGEMRGRGCLEVGLDPEGLCLSLLSDGLDIGKQMVYRAVLPQLYTVWVGSVDFGLKTFPLYSQGV